MKHTRFTCDLCKKEVKSGHVVTIPPGGVKIENFDGSPVEGEILLGPAAEGESHFHSECFNVIASDIPPSPPHGLTERTLELARAITQDPIRDPRLHVGPRSAVDTHALDVLAQGNRAYIMGPVLETTQKIVAEA